ncbi:MAG: hypothetical protein QHC90_28620 [Shinella sp.]|nr:hypothetical protein [Shinella sp.]
MDESSEIDGAPLSPEQHDYACRVAAYRIGLWFFCRRRWCRRNVCCGGPLEEWDLSDTDDEPYIIDLPPCIDSTTSDEMAQFEQFYDQVGEVLQMEPDFRPLRFRCLKGSPKDHR